MITANTIADDYAKLQAIILKLIKRKKYEKACFFMMKAAVLMYNANLIYTDDELEHYLNELSCMVLPESSVMGFTGGKDRILLYDYFVLDNRGLTEQYLSGLMSIDCDLYFLGCQNGENSKEIYSKLKANNIRTYIIEPCCSELKKAESIFQIINDIKPTVIISHTAPWDIAGLMAINRFSSSCRKYLINITDHAFWLGKTVFDYFFEFRNYGCCISTKYRGIPEDRLLKLPYYPIINKNIQFQGFDFETEGKRIIFSGGSIYKIKGSNVFLDIVKYILSNYPDTVFLFLGNGDSQFLQDFISKNNFENRFYYRHERKDIYEIFKRCYLYINTYPLIGGLMTQYACVCGKIPLTLNDKNDHCNDISELMYDNNSLDIQFESIEDFKNKIDVYLNDKNLVDNDGDIISKSIVSETAFNSLLLNYINTPTNQLSIKYYDIDISEFSKQYIARFNENNCLDYYKLFLSKNMVTLPYFFKYYIKYMMKVF